MNESRTKHIQIIKYSVFIIFLTAFVDCIKPNSGKAPPLFASNVTPYTPADLGIDTPPADSPLSTLPAISDSERNAIEEAFRLMNENGQLDQKFVKESSMASREMFSPTVNRHRVGSKGGNRTKRPVLSDVHARNRTTNFTPRKPGRRRFLRKGGK